MIRHKVRLAGGSGIGAKAESPLAPTALEVVLTVALGMWMLLAVPISLLLRDEHQFIPLGQLIAVEMFRMPDQVGLVAAYGLKLVDCAFLSIAAFNLLTSLRHPRRLGYGLAVFAMFASSLLLLSFTLKNLSDAGLLTEEIAKSNIRDWGWFAVLSIHSAVIGILAALRGGLR